MPQCLIRRFSLLDKDPFGRRGFVLFVVLAVAICLILLGILLHTVSGQQSFMAHNQRFGEGAHFLAESGTAIALHTLRHNILDRASALREALLDPGLQSDHSLNTYLGDTFRRNLDQCAAEVDPRASLQVEVWLTGLRQTETDPARWADPSAKVGWIRIEAIGQVRGMASTLTTRYPFSIGSGLPPVYSRFTLHMRNAAQGEEGRFNVVRNDRAGRLATGPAPIVCFNHATPDHPLEPRPLADIQAEEKDPQGYLHRGWVYLGGGNARLNLTAGEDNLGEAFLFGNPEVAPPPSGGRYKIDSQLLPTALSQPLTTFWDLLEVDPSWVVTYHLDHSFALDGFFDRGHPLDSEAMYGNGVLTAEEQKTFGARSSLLHLFGKASPGYRSPTMVLGRVTAVFPKWSILEVTPENPEVKDAFKDRSPPPRFLFPSMGDSGFDASKRVVDFLERRFGGPDLEVGALVPDEAGYRPLASDILEYPYARLFNCFLQAMAGDAPLRFPPPRTDLEEDLGGNLSWSRGGQPVYRGSAMATAFLDVVEGRVQREVTTVADFLDRFFDAPTNTLKLNRIVRILNPAGENLVLPPVDTGFPLQVAGGGMIVLEQGSLILRGVQVVSPAEALTVVLVNGPGVFFDNPRPNQVNIVGLQAQVQARAPIDLCGTLAVRDILAGDRFPGGSIRFREAQDPTGSRYADFYQIDIAEKDGSWHE